MRARNLKPGFFKNELLASCSWLAQKLFQGLWCLADREGRLEDRVDRIKAEVLPYDDCDVSGLLNELQDKGFILRYIVRGAAFICLPTFLEHQRPHPKEIESKIPPPKSRVMAALHKRFAVPKSGRPVLLSESPFPLASAAPIPAAADSIQSEFADLIAALEQRGLTPELARLYVCEDVDLPLVRAVLKFHAAAEAAKKLRNPIGALRGMLNNPSGWGFSRTDAGDWDMPFDVAPPCADPKAIDDQMARRRAERIANEKLKAERAKGGTA